MALLHTDLFSDCLGRAVAVDIIIPQKSRALIGMRTERGDTFRTLYLLHGFSDDCTIWQRRTSIERYAADKNMAVVMPSAGKSWYTDMKYGDAYFSFIADELPALCRSFFNGMSAGRDDNFIAGLSMGGYGALKIGLSKPGTFAGIACLSGAFDVHKRVLNAFMYGSDADRRYWTGVFGSPEEIPNSPNDITFLAKNAAGKQTLALPSVYMWCGTEDSLLSESRECNNLLTACGFTVNYNESKGNHSWIYWDEQIKKVIDYFTTE